MYVCWTIYRYTEIIHPKRILEKEQQELWDHLEALNSPIVFCHNDLLPKNIIYNEEKGNIPEVFVSADVCQGLTEDAIWKWLHEHNSLKLKRRIIFVVLYSSK